MEFSSKNTGEGCHFLAQGILPTQGSNLNLAHCRQILYHMSHQGSPWVCSNTCRKSEGCGQAEQEVGSKWQEQLSRDRPQYASTQFSSVAQSCPTHCNPMDCSMPGLPVHHQLLEFTQTHVHWIDDAIQPSHPLSSPAPPAFNLSQQQGLFKWVSFSHQVAKVLEFQLQHQSFQWIFRTDFLHDGQVGSPCSPRDSQESSPTP